MGFLSIFVFSTKSASKFWRLKNPPQPMARAPRQQDIGFLTVNLAAYSPRPNTPAAELQDQVPEVPVEDVMEGGELEALPIPLKPTRRGPP